MWAGSRMFGLMAAMGWCLGTAVWAQETVAPPASTVTLVNAGAEPRQPLAYRFQAGQFSHYEVVNTMTMQTQYQQVSQVVKNESTAWRNFRVVSVDEQGNAVLEPTVQRVVMKAQFDDGAPIECDTDQPDTAPPQFREVVQMVKRPIAQVKMSAQGELQAVTLLDGAPARLKSAGNVNDQQLNFLAVLPREPVGVGAVWRERFDIAVFLDQQLTQRITLQRTYELTKLEGTRATISLKTAAITPINDPKVELQLLQRTPAGTLEFDTAQGRVIAQRLVSDREVVGAAGPQSKVNGRLETVERLVPSVAGNPPARLDTSAQ